MRLIHWIIFGVGHCLGFTLILLDHGPCAGILAIPGLVMLLPGCLIAFALQHWLRELPQWAGYLVAGSVVISVNALVWYFAGKIGDRELQSRRRPPDSLPL